MEARDKNMDFQARHWAPYARRFPARFPLASAGWIRAKDRWDRRSFDVCAFSLILRGRGELHRGGRLWPVQAPCVFTQWPGEYLEYGPGPGQETWDELYLVYEPGLFESLRAVGLIDPERPLWPIANPEAAFRLAREFAALSRHPEPEAVVDRIDRLAEWLVLETWLAPGASGESDQAVDAAIAKLRAAPGEALDLERIAAERGLSLRTFRRRWVATVGAPPAKFIQEFRLREACRLLVETKRPVHEIAAAVGFEDELYFSRRFRRALGMPPRDYRKTFRLNR
jgi:AraC-like DNA-binding protein